VEGDSSPLFVTYAGILQLHASNGCLRRRFTGRERSLTERFDPKVSRTRSFGDSLEPRYIVALENTCDSELFSATLSRMGCL